MGSYIKYFLVICIIATSTGCATQSYKTWVPEPIEVIEEPVFNPDLTVINEPIEKPNWLYAKEKGNELVFTDGKDPEAKYLVLSAEEYKKIKSLLVKQVETKGLLIDTVELVNAKIDTINTLHYRVQMERNLTGEYHKLWLNANEAFEKERRQHLIDNLVHRGIIAVTVVGGIALMAL